VSGAQGPKIEEVHVETNDMDSIVLAFVICTVQRVPPTKGTPSEVLAALSALGPETAMVVAGCRRCAAVAVMIAKQAREGSIPLPGDPLDPLAGMPAAGRA